MCDLSGRDIVLLAPGVKQIYVCPTADYKGASQNQLHRDVRLGGRVQIGDC